MRTCGRGRDRPQVALGDGVSAGAVLIRVVLAACGEQLSPSGRPTKRILSLSLVSCQ